MIRGDFVSFWKQSIGTRVMKTAARGSRLVTKWEWRWRRFSANGRIVGCSSEGYLNRKDCIANAKRCMSKCRMGFEK